MLLPRVYRVFMKFNQLRESSASHLARTAGFYLSVVVFLLMWLMIFAEGLVGVFRIWLDPAIAGTHFVHGATFMTLIWILGLAMLVQLYRPVERITAMRVALLVPIIAAFDIAIQVVDGVFDPMILVFFAPVLIAAALHPARRNLVPRRVLSREGTTVPLLGLAAVAVVPVAVYAVGQATLQLTLADEHAVVSHYSTMVSFTILLVALAALAGVVGSGGRGPAYAAAVMAIVFAAASWYQPTASAIDPIWALLAVLWGLAVVVAFEWTTFRTTSRNDLIVEDPDPTS